MTELNLNVLVIAEGLNHRYLLQAFFRYPVPHYESIQKDNYLLCILTICI